MDDNSKHSNSNQLHEYRINRLEEYQKEIAVRVGGLELWKAKVEDIIKGKVSDPANAAVDATGKDWVKIVILALTIISGLVALLTQAIK